ncbi:MAG: protein kinase [Polyangiaceae bacterium]|nr:protein kinase [Polyangiaceae bacterium]
MLRKEEESTFPPPGGGKEEIRASHLKPYLLRLREERGEGAVKALLSTAGLPPGILDDETRWISVAAMQRGLRSLASALGEDAIGSRGPWMVHPEILGGYVRMLRIAATPEDGLRYLATNAAETNRAGTFIYENLEPGHSEVRYTPRPEVETNQSDRLLCLARKAEFASIPRIWGLEDARVEDLACLSQGDVACKYSIHYSFKHRSKLPFFAVGGAAICGIVLALSQSWVAVLIGIAIGAGVGAALGSLSDKVAHQQLIRTFEQNRISALERGLELRGQTKDAAGDLSGSTLGGKYRILRRIGSGGIGAVYAAEHVALGSRVAIKVLRGAAAADASEIARLRREAQVQVSIKHPNVVRTLDLDQMPDGSIYVVMELLRGVSVAERLQRRGPLTPAFAVPIFIQVCRALAAAHQLGVVHRDLKPANVFICEDDSAKVLDFGMSKFAEADTLTEHGYTLGTPEYMSPEQCIGAPVESRTDLYALGVLMYEALTGELPIQTRNRRDLLELHQRTVPPSMRERRPDLDIPQALDNAVMMCLAKRAAERPASARELEGLLLEVDLAGLPLEYPPGTPWRVSSRNAPSSSSFA